MGRKVGAEFLNDNITRFTVWAPFAEHVEVLFKGKDESTPLEKDNTGYWSREIKEVSPGSLYKYRLDGEKELADPASRSQPEGVHSWSRVLNTASHTWSDEGWKGTDISEMVIYELHIGTFTPQGTFEAVIEKLDHLKDLGINTLEIMPVAQFPGNRNWGYDGVYPYAAQHSYGGADGLKKMIDACHQQGIAVILDAVYNHMGPEGNYLAEYGPYFTTKYETPWGKAINFDDKYSDEVRNFFLQNALMWMEEFRFDGLRLDAIHEIIDRGARHFLKELSEKTDELEERTGRRKVLIAESDLNDVKIINSYEKGGFGLEAQWVDDFHHSLHTIITGEKGGYYQDFGKVEQLGKSFRQAFIYDGIYSRFRKRTVGNSPAGLAKGKFVVCIQNHDQVGNRMLGERLSQLVSLESRKLAAAVYLLSPFTPMLFMGEEFAEEQPFQYFVSHGDPDLVKAVQEGRKREFKYFMDDEGDFPDPQAEETFNNSKLNWNFRGDTDKENMLSFYKELLGLRKREVLTTFRENEILVEHDEDDKTLKVAAGDLVAVFNFSSEAKQVKLSGNHKDLDVILASADKRWNGPREFPKHLKAGGQIQVPPTSMLLCKS